jgi:hypothetical protein
MDNLAAASVHHQTKKCHHDDPVLLSALQELGILLIRNTAGVKKQGVEIHMGQDQTFRFLSLQTLRIDARHPDEDEFDEDAWCVDASDILWRLAPCLPALDSLSLVHVVEDYIDAVSAIERLMPGLTQLSVGGKAFDDEAASFVAKLTSLRELDWVDSDITSDGLQALTALTNLNWLIVDNCPGLSDPVRNLAGREGVELSTSEEVRGRTGRVDWLMVPVANFACA